MIGNPHDEIDLKDQIKSLKLKKQQLLDEQKDLKEQINIFEGKTSQLKIQHNILGPIGELRYGGNDIYETSSRSSLGGDYAESKYEGNDRKMELKILNEEIRAALPRLETEALRWEKKIANADKEADILEGKISRYPNTLVKPIEVMEKELGEGIEQRIKLKSKLARDVDSQKRERSDLTEDILSAKEQLLSLLEERDVIKEAGQRSKQYLIAEAARIEVLLNEQQRLRLHVAMYGRNSSGGDSNDIDNNDNDDDGRWEEEAFVSAAGSDSARLPQSDVFDLISKWLPPQQVDRAAEQGLISFYCRGSSKAEMDFRSFCQLCEKILTIE